MAERTLYELLISLTGTATPSLYQAFEKARVQSAALQKSVTQLNTALHGISTTSKTSAISMTSHFAAAARSMSMYARNISMAWTRAGAQMRHALHPITGPLGAIGSYTGMFAGMAAVGGAFAGEELLRNSWEVHAKREAARIGMATVLKNRGMGGETKAFEDMLLELTGDQTKIEYETAFRSSQLMLNSGKINDLKALQTFLKQMADLGGTPAENAKGMMAIAKMFSEGRIEGRHMYELVSDVPSIPWYSDVAKVLGMKGGAAEMRKFMSKPGTTIDSAVIQKVMEMETGPGGRVKGMSAAQMLGPEGAGWRLKARWKVFEDALGKMEGSALLPLINKALGDSSITEFKDRLNAAAVSAGQFGEQLATAYDVLRKSGALSETAKLLGDIANEIGAAFGIKGQNNVDVMTSAWKRMNDALRWIRDHFKDIEWWISAVVKGWVAIQAWKVASGVVTAIATLTGAFLALKGAATGAQVAMEGAAAAKAGGAGAVASLGGALALPVGVGALALYGAHEAIARSSHDPLRMRGAEYAQKLSDTTEEYAGKQKELSQNFDIGKITQDKYIESLKALDTQYKALIEGLQKMIQTNDQLIQHSGGSGSHTPGYGLPDPGPNALGYKGYESYPGEGHAANYGFNDTPMRNDQDAHIGNITARAYGLKRDDMVHIPGVGWRRYHDVSERPHGIELHTGRKGSTPSRMKIDKIQRGDSPPVNVSIQYSPTIHASGDTRGLATTLKSHSEHLAKMLDSAMKEHSRLSYA